MAFYKYTAICKNKQDLKATELINDFIALLFPNYCFTCRKNLVKGEQYICSNCRLILPRTNIHLSQRNPLLKLYGGLLPIDNFYTYLKFTKGGKVQKIMEKLKYQNCPEIGTLLGNWYGTDLKEAGVLNQFDLIVPVPLHLSKLRKRGYNQSDFFAKGLSQALEVPWDGKALVRKSKNETQTRKSREERFKNVSGIFDLGAAAAIKNQRVLLVDDVITTGATLFASAQPLLAGGCNSISLATLAVAQ